MHLLKPQAEETLLPLDLQKPLAADRQEKPASLEQPPLVDFIPDEEEYFDFQI